MYREEFKTICRSIYPYCYFEDFDERCSIFGPTWLGTIMTAYFDKKGKHCPYFVEVVIKEGEQRPGQKPGWRQYCGKGNFNINRASYVVTKTSHNKNKVVPENLYEWEYTFPNRCPLRKENF